jgi:hypothetical protein
MHVAWHVWYELEMTILEWRTAGLAGVNKGGFLEAWLDA